MKFLSSVPAVAVLLLSFAPSSAYKFEQKVCTVDEDCLHDGTCVTNANNGTYCRCRAGYGGHDCSVQCSLNCLNNGQCRIQSEISMDAIAQEQQQSSSTVDDKTYEHCHCIGNFMGDMCEIPVHKCADGKLICQYNGVCRKTELEDIMMVEYHCECPSDRYGDHCEYSREQPLGSEPLPEVPKGLSMGNKIGISIFVVVIVVAMGGFAMAVRRRRRANRARDIDDAVKASVSNDPTIDSKNSNSFEVEDLEDEEEDDVRAVTEII